MAAIVRRVRLRRLMGGNFALLLAATVGCLVGEGDERCSVGQRLDARDECVCKDAHIPVYKDLNITTETPAGAALAIRCDPCPENEITGASGKTCECGEGLVRNPDSELCEEPEGRAGMTCAADADCGEGEFCQVEDLFSPTEGDPTNRPGYCSASCATDADCPLTGYRCAPLADGGGPGGSFCRRPASGEGDECDMLMGDRINPACDQESTVCILNICVSPEVCDPEAAQPACTPGLICCDFSSFPDGVPLCTSNCPF